MPTLPKASFITASDLSQEADRWISSWGWWRWEPGWHFAGSRRRLVAVL